MVSGIYELIGRIVIRLAWLRVARQVKIAGGGLAVLALGIGYLLSRRQPPEG